MDLNIEYLASSSWDDSILPKLKHLQQREPVYWSEKDQVWVITRFDDVSYVSKRQELFTSAEGVRPNNPAKITLIDEGEPRHGQLRKLLNKGFTPRMVKKLEAVFRDITRDAIDAVAHKGQCDFVEDIAVPLPLLLIAEMIGIRKEDHGRFHQWSDAMIAADGRMDDPVVTGKAAQAFMEYSTYVSEIIADRRENPKDDFVSILTSADDDGVLGTMDQQLHAGLSSEEHLARANSELMMILVLLLVAGNETTRNGISGGMNLLIQHPEARQRLIDDPSLIPGAVEEMVRMVSPVRSFGRTATQDTELRGVQIKKGERVLMIYGTANRDPEQFENPDVFDIERNPHHVGFGLGSHFCLGANLARMEMRVAFEELLRRIPDMEFTAAGPVYAPSALVRTCVEMQVKFTPET
jgi:cytochrome P450 family 142 subfamily A polypeptide 1